MEKFDVGIFEKAVEKPRTTRRSGIVDATRSVNGIICVLTAPIERDISDSDPEYDDKPDWNGSSDEASEVNTIEDKVPDPQPQKVQATSAANDI